MRRELITAFVGSAVLVGCLFPSFDGLKGTGVKPSGEDDDGDTTPPRDGGKGTSASSASSSSSSSGSTSSSSSSSGGGADSGTTPDAGPPAKKLVRCGNIDCDMATTVCCGKFMGSSECRPMGNTNGCSSVLVCDGPEDCATGQRCCQNSIGGNNTVCKTDCGGGYTFCHPEAPATCPPNEPKCNGDNIGIFGAEPISCQ